jgi:hypothetical protein
LTDTAARIDIVHARRRRGPHEVSALDRCGATLRLGIEVLAGSGASTTPSVGIARYVIAR